MSAPRGKCGFCKRDVAVRKPDVFGDRLPYAHTYRRGATYSAVCPGEHQPAEDVDAAPSPPESNS